MQSGTLYLELKPYFGRRSELTIHEGCLMHRMRVVVPPKLQQPVLEEIHQGHPGIVRSKELVRSYVWWPSVENDLKNQEWTNMAQRNYLSADGASVVRGQDADIHRTMYVEATRGPLAASLCCDDVPICGGGGGRNVLSRLCSWSTTISRCLRN
nr:uncharacterized protein LOC126524233 [Dermacentor andersoni]